MYLILNKDGSIRESQLDDYINKGSDGVNFLDVAIYGDDAYVSPDGYTATGSFLLPNGTTSLTATAVLNNSITTSSGVVEGYRFYFYEAFTQYPGTLKFSLVATFSDKTMVSYAREFTVNDSAIYKDTTITWEEYENLMKTIQDYQLKYSMTNVRAYVSHELAKADLDNLADSQMVICPADGRQAGEELDLFIVGTSSDGTKKLVLTAMGYEGLADWYVAKEHVSASAVQKVPSGLTSYYTDSDGNQVNYGTEVVSDGNGFFAYVLDASSNYAGKVSLGAKVFEFLDTQSVKFLEMDNSTTYLRAPNATSWLQLGTGEAKLYGNSIYIGSESAESGGYGGTIKIGNCIEIANGGSWVSIKASSGTSIERLLVDGTLSVSRTSTFAMVPTTNGGDPTSDNQLTRKAYVDKKVASDVSTASTALQTQIDAINASQNFVATYATKADMPNASSATGLDENDCALVLKDEDHQSQAYVYKWTATAWVEVGPLGDYYTKAYVDNQFAVTNGNVAYYKSQTEAYASRVDEYERSTDDKITELGKVVDAAKDAYLASTPTFVETSSSTEESDITPTLVGLFAETGSSTQLSE